MEILTHVKFLQAFRSLFVIRLFLVESVTAEDVGSSRGQGRHGEGIDLNKS